MMRYTIKPGWLTSSRLAEAMMGNEEDVGDQIRAALSSFHVADNKHPLDVAAVAIAPGDD